MFDVSKLNGFTSESGKAYALRSVLEAHTIKILSSFDSFDPTLKGSTYINLLDSDIILQSGDQCGFNAQGGVSLAQAVISVDEIKLNDEFCERTLVKYFTKGRLAKGLDYTELSLQNEIAESITGKVNAEIETLIWQGDKSNGVGNLKRTDGFLKAIEAGNHVAPVITGATTTIQKLQKAHKAMPTAVKGKADYRIWMSEDVFADYVAELAEKNLFTPQNEKVLFGTTAKIEVVSGLNDTGKVVLSRARNLQAGGEMTDVALSVWYSIDSDMMKAKLLFSLGATVIYPEEVGLVDLTA